MLSRNANKDNKVLKYYSEENLLKFPAIIYGDLEFFLKKCTHVKKISYREKRITPSGFSLFTNCWFDATKNKLDSLKGKDCM